MKPVRSLRDFRVGAAGNNQEDGIARGKPVKASSTYVEPGNDYRPENAVDGLPDTRWSSEFSDPQWLAVDLGAPTEYLSRRAGLGSGVRPELRHPGLFGWQHLDGRLYHD